MTAKPVAVNPLSTTSTVPVGKPSAWWAAPAFLLAAAGVWRAVPDMRVAAAGADPPLSETVGAAARAVRDRRIALAVAGAALMLFGFQAATAFLTTYLVDAKGLTQGTAGAVLGALFVVGAVSQWTVGPVANANVIDLLPDAVRGTTWGGLRTALFLVGSTGSTLVGVVADAGLFDAAFYLLAGLTAVGAVIYLLLPERP